MLNRGLRQASIPQCKSLSWTAYSWLCGWHGVLVLLVGTSYFMLAPQASISSSWSVWLTAWFSHFGLYTALTAGLGGLLIGILPRRWLAVCLPSLFSLSLLLVVLDAWVFSRYRFHLSGFVFQFIWHGEVIQLPWLLQWQLGFGCLLVWGLYAVVWWRLRQSASVRQSSHLKLGLATLGVWLGSLLYSHGAFAYYEAQYYQPVMQLKTYLPWYYPLTAKTWLVRHGWVQPDLRQGLMQPLANASRQTLRYPVAALQTEVPQQPLDILFLVIDGWRYDTLDAAIMPQTLAQMTQQPHQQWLNHYSTGNATRYGVFGLFYGLSGRYWDAVLQHQQRPVLMTRLQELGYQWGIFASSQLQYPEFNRTIFQGVPNLRIRTQGANSCLRDRKATEEWRHWYETRDRSRSTFSFLFYDAAHAYCLPPDYPATHTPVATHTRLNISNDTDPVPIFNRYKNSLHYLDSLLAQVYDVLTQQQAWTHTLVVLTSDHGEEMNDNRQNYWGHGSNFTDAQVRIPLVMMGEPLTQLPAPPTHKITSHYDVAPTLMQHWLGVTSPIHQYSHGEDLWLHPDKSQRTWLEVTEYNGYGLLSPTQIHVISDFGTFESYNKQYLKQPTDLNFMHVKQHLLDFNRFYAVGD
jgi:uncharacterized protein